MLVGRLALAFTALALPVAAGADCPTNIADLPAAGFLASAMRTVTEPDAEQPPALTAHIGASGGLRADADAVLGAGTLGGQIAAQRSGFAGCASADVLAARDVSAHVTASAEVPLLFTGLSLGFSLDREVELPLSARPAYLLAPANRIAGQVSVSFLDFGITDQRANRLRVMIVPFTVEEALERQTTDVTHRERRTTTIDTAMMRFAASGPDGAGRFDVFAIAASWIDLPGGSPAGATGFLRASPLALESDRSNTWTFTLDGGVLVLAGGVDCEQVECGRGFYRLALGHNWQRLSIEARAERSGLLMADDTPAIDDRLGATTTLTTETRSAALTAFAALTRPWTGGPAERTGGVRVVATQQLGGGFLALVDAELARSFYGVAAADPTAVMPTIQPSAARVMLSLGWQASVAR